MDDECRKKKLPPWFEFFNELEKVQRLMDDVFRAFENPKRRRRSHDPCAYSFSVSFKPDGNLTTRRSKDSRACHVSSLDGEWEPLIDVFEHDDEVAVIVSVPGVKKEEIGLYAAGDRLTISINNPELRYHKEIFLPTEVDPESARATYKNGVLEVRLKTVTKKLSKGRGVF